MRDKASTSGGSVQSPTSTMMNCVSLDQADEEHADTGSWHDRPLDPDIPEFIVFSRSFESNQDEWVRISATETAGDAPGRIDEDLGRNQATMSNDSAPRLPHRRSSAKAFPKLPTQHLQELEDLFDTCQNDLMPLKPTRVRSVGVSETSYDGAAAALTSSSSPEHPKKAFTSPRKSWRYPSPVLSPTQEAMHDDSMSPTLTPRRTRQGNAKPDCLRPCQG